MGRGTARVFELRALSMWPKAARAWTETRIRTDLESSHSILLQQYSRVERVTGIEPALSAWEW